MSSCGSDLSNTWQNHFHTTYIVHIHININKVVFFFFLIFQTQKWLIIIIIISHLDDNRKSNETKETKQNKKLIISMLHLIRVICLCVFEDFLIFIIHFFFSFSFVSFKLNGIAPIRDTNQNTAQLLYAQIDPRMLNTQFWSIQYTFHRIHYDLLYNEILDFYRCYWFRQLIIIIIINIGIRSEWNTCFTLYNCNMDPLMSIFFIDFETILNS